MGSWLTRRRALLAVLALIGFLFAALPAAAAGTAAQIVACTGFAGCFSPNPIRVTAGSAITWTNNTGPTHTATSDTGAWNTGNIAAGQTSTPINFNQAGTFTYHCAIHPNMTGTIIVTAAVTTTAAPTAAPAASPRTLAQGGGGPAPFLGLLAVLLGLVLLATRRPASRRPQHARSVIKPSGRVDPNKHV